MAIGRVGVEGTVASTGTATITPSIPQSSTAGNLLTAWIVALSGATAGIVSSSSSGWLQAVEKHANEVAVAIWYKPNCGAGEANPTFTSSTSGFMRAKINEWLGADQSAPLEQLGSFTATTSPQSLACGGIDAVLGNLVLACAGIKYAPAQVSNSTNSLNNGATVTANSSDAAGSATNHYDICAYGITTSHVAVDTDTFTFTTTSIHTCSGAIASFRPVPVPSIVPSSVTYASTAN